MSEEEIKGELQNLQKQVALLQKEQAVARKSWTLWLASTGLILVVLGVAVFIAVWKDLAQANLNAGVAALVLMAIFLFVLGLYLFSWQLWGERVSRNALR